MNTHTPGPWDWDTVSDDGSVIARGGGMIASVYGPDDFPCLREDGDVEELWEQHRANARLIAAAPELYSALKALLETVEAGDNDDALVKAAFAAIAKVDGQ